MFEKRSYQAELIDELTLGGDVMAQTMRELKFINKWLGGNAVTTRGLDQLYKKFISRNHTKILRIADIGCGGGDMLILIAKWARKRKINVQLTGIDANDYTIDYAKKNTSQYPEISYQTLDVFSPQFRKLSFDIVTCTLFCHHFKDEQLIRLFSQLHKQTKIGVVINDLHRHWLAYHSIKYLTQWFSRSYLVKNDAKLSVLRAFSKEDILKIFSHTDYNSIQINWKWAFRWQVLASN